MVRTQLSHDGNHHSTARVRRSWTRFGVKAPSALSKARLQPSRMPVLHVNLQGVTRYGGGSLVFPSRYWSS